MPLQRARPGGGRDLARFWVCPGILILFHAVSLAAPLGYHPRLWTRDQGLPDNEVRALLETRDGYLWIGPREGLARFDGLHFTIFRRANTPELISPAVTTLAEDRAGQLWVGTDKGLLCRQGTGWRRFAEFADRAVTVLEPSAAGGMWVGCEDGLSRFEGGSLAAVDRSGRFRSQSRDSSLRRGSHALIHRHG